jgi:multimeric flavodoxin WrbA
MSARKQIVLVNGSPKPDKDQSASEVLIHLLENNINSSAADIHQVNVRQSLIKNKTDEDFHIISKADAVIFIFPLYVFCLPGILMQYLQEYFMYWSKDQYIRKQMKIYAVVNCGFTETDINEEAIRVIRSFSRQIGASFRFGVSIGGGGMLLSLTTASFMKKTLSELKDAFKIMCSDIAEDGSGIISDIMVPIRIPRKLYYFFGNQGWFQSAKKNNLKKKDLYRQPYYDDK